MADSVPQLLNVRDVAQALRVSPYTVRRWDAQGKLRGMRLGCGRRVLFHPDEVAAFVERARQAASRNGNTR